MCLNCMSVAKLREGPGLQLFLERQKNKVPKNAIKIEGQWGET